MYLKETNKTTINIVAKRGLNEHLKMSSQFRFLCEKINRQTNRENSEIKVVNAAPKAPYNGMNTKFKVAFNKTSIIKEKEANLVFPLG